MRSETLSRSSGKVPVLAEVDVLVCGGGLGGVAAAMASAKAGAKTLLVERNGCLGGVATAGMCCSIFNCYYTGGSERKLMNYGAPVEIADALAEATGYGLKWREHKGHVIYDLEKGKLALQDLVLKTGAKILLQSWASDVVMDGRTLKGVVLDGKSGRRAVLAKAVVDATGDSDVAFLAGAPLREERRGLHSLCFRLGNVDVDRFVDYFVQNPGEYPERMDVDWSRQEALLQYKDCGSFLFPHGGGKQMKAFQLAKESGELPATVGLHDTTDACQMHALRSTGVVHVVTGFTHNYGADSTEVSDSILDGRRMAFVVAEVYKRRLPGFDRSFVAGIAENLGVRTSRWLDGDFVFSRSMMEAGSRHGDLVGRSVGFIDVVRHKGPGAWGVQICAEDSFDIPLRCLLPKEIDGLVMGAGRSVSAERPELLRVMVHTMAVGQGAGTAAAISARAGSVLRETDPSQIRRELERQGALPAE